MKWNKEFIILLDYKRFFNVFEYWEILLVLYNIFINEICMFLFYFCGLIFVDGIVVESVEC